MKRRYSGTKMCGKLKFKSQIHGRYLCGNIALKLQMM